MATTAVRALTRPASAIKLIAPSGLELLECSVLAIAIGQWLGRELPLGHRRRAGDNLAVVDELGPDLRLAVEPLGRVGEDVQDGGDSEMRMALGAQCPDPVVLLIQLGPRVVVIGAQLDLGDAA